MMTTFQTGYVSLGADDNDGPPESVIFHVASESSKSNMDYIEDLDAFFRGVYFYHQKRGYTCILAENVLDILLFSFLCFVLIYGSNCIYFTLSPFKNHTGPVHLNDLFIPVSECAKNNFGVGTWFLVIIITLILVVVIIRNFINARYYKSIQQFFENSMKVPRNEIQNVTWHDIQCKLREVQHEQQMCVNNTDLTDLDISHRILRYKNYTVAMVNKNILPLRYNVPFLGEWLYLPNTLLMELEYLFFTGPYSPFSNSGRLKEEFKRREDRIQCAESLKKQMFVICVFSFVFFPFVWVYQILSYLLNYSGYMRLDPGFLMHRNWSNFAKLSLRHFNELDHQLDARLGRAYKASRLYMRSFTSPLVSLMTGFVLRMAGFFVAGFTLWSVLEDQLIVLVPSVAVIIATGAILFHALLALQQDENEVFFPNELMQMIVSEVHYVPDNFKTMAHTSYVRDNFSHYFPYRVIHWLEEVLSPLLNIIVIWKLRNRCLEITDFFRNFTVHVDGVGDVCSFALMDVLKHGNRQWLGPNMTKADVQNQAEDGKTEMSALHFAHMNPYWQPPPSTQQFIEDFRVKVTAAKTDVSMVANQFYASLNSLGSTYGNLVRSTDGSPQQSMIRNAMSPGCGTGQKVHTMRVTKVEGPAHYVPNSLLPSVFGDDMESSSLGLNPVAARRADMRLSAMLLHEAHDRHLASFRSRADSRSQGDAAETSEHSPLLNDRTNFSQ